MHAGPDGNALYNTDPDLVTAKFANISEDTIVYR